MFAGHSIATTPARESSALGAPVLCPYECKSGGLEVGHAVFVEADYDAASGYDDGSADETRILGHPGDGFAAGGRVIVHFLLSKSLGAGIEEILVIAPAD